MSTDSIKWIHCNRCFTLLTDKITKLFLTTCQHILCKSCIVKETATKKLKCCICSVCVNVVAIDRQIPDKFKIYFHPKPWEKTRNWMSIVEFQSKQRIRIPRFLIKSESESEKDDKAIAERKNQIKELIRDRNEYRRKMAAIMPVYRKYRARCRQLMADEPSSSSIEMDSGFGDSFTSASRQ